MLLSDRHLVAPVKGRPWTSGVVSLVGAGHEVGPTSAGSTGGWTQLLQPEAGRSRKWTRVGGRGQHEHVRSCLPSPVP